MILPNGYSVTKDGHVLNSAGIELKQNDRKGYLYVTIKRKKYSIHRLVAMTYIPNPYNKAEVDHLDGNPQNNNVENLRWATRSENESNPITRERISKANKGKIITLEQRKKIAIKLTGLKQSEETKAKRAEKLRGRKRPEHVIKAVIDASRKPVICIEKYTGRKYNFISQKEAAEYFGISPATISCCISGKLKSKKYIWKRS